MFIFCLEPFPLPECLNQKLSRVTSYCFVHLFYKTANYADFSFVSSFESCWMNLYVDIEKELAHKGLPIFHIKVGIVTNSDIMPTLENGQDFFSSAESYVTGRRIMTIIASSRPECKY